MKLSRKSRWKKGEDDIGRNKFSAYNEEPGDENKKEKMLKKALKKLFHFKKFLLAKLYLTNNVLTYIFLLVILIFNINFVI